MSSPGGLMTPIEARAVVDAQLGRPPQDALEAAVVLEAWGGLQAGDALVLARACVDHEVVSLGHDSARDANVAGRADRLVTLGEVGFVLGVLFTGFWLSALAADLGERSVDRAWRLALPISLGAQWLLKRRYISGDDGLGRLKQELLRLALPAAAVLGIVGLVPDGGLLAAALTVIWTGGFLATRRGWGIPYAVALVAVAVALRAVDARVVVLITTLGMLAAAAGALGSVGRSRRRPGPWARAAPAGLIGASLGLLLVFEPPFGWHTTGRYLPVLTVVPSLVGSLWGGFHMTRLWEVMPAVLVSTSVRDRRSGSIGRLTSRLLLESLGRLALGVGITSAIVLLWVGSRASLERDRRLVVGLLIAHGVLAVAALSVALLEAFGRWGWALLAAALGVLAAFGADRVVDHAAFAGARILIGAVVALLGSAIPLVALLREPDRNVAAAL